MRCGARSRSGRGAAARSRSTPPSPQFSFDRDGNVAAAELSEQTESHRLIEHLMIAANEQVARFLSEHKIPALYRVHERPEAPAVERLIDQLESLGVPTPPVPKGHLTPQQAADVVGEASVMVADWVRRTGRGGRALTSLVLRSLKQAYYDPRNLGHAGLALDALLPLHLADPPLPGPHLPPRRCCQRDRGRADAGRVVGGERRRRGRRSASARR